jgi:hypothetical protein
MHLGRTLQYTCGLKLSSRLLDRSLRCAGWSNSVAFRWTELCSICGYNSVELWSIQMTSSLQHAGGQNSAVCSWAELYSMQMGRALQYAGGQNSTACRWAELYNMQMGKILQHAVCRWAELYSMQVGTILQNACGQNFAVRRWAEFFQHTGVRTLQNASGQNSAVRRWEKLCGMQMVRSVQYVGGKNSAACGWALPGCIHVSKTPNSVAAWIMFTVYVKFVHVNYSKDSSIGLLHQQLMLTFLTSWLFT